MIARLGSLVILIAALTVVCAVPHSDTPTLHPIALRDLFGMLSGSVFTATDFANGQAQQDAEQELLTYMRARRSPRWIFDVAGERNALLTELRDDKSLLGRAERDLTHVFFFAGHQCFVGTQVNWAATASPAEHCTGGGTEQPVNGLPDWNHALNRLDWLPEVAAAYLVSGDDRFATEAMTTIWLSWVRGNPMPPEIPTRGPWRPLEVAHRSLAMLQTYYLLLDSPVMTPHMNAIALRSLVEHAVFLDAVNRQTYLSGNYGQAYAAALLVLGTMLPEMSGRYFAMRGFLPERYVSGSAEWMDVGGTRVEEMLSTGGYLWGERVPADVSPEGWSSEYVPDYHQVGARLLGFALQVLSNNPDEPSVRTRALLLSTLRARHFEMMDVLYRYQSSDGMFYGPGDTILRSARPVLGLGVALHGVPRWKSRSIRPSVLQVGPQGLARYDNTPDESLAPASFLDPIAGFAVLRPYTRGNADDPNTAQMIFVDGNEPRTQIHQHQDSGQLALFAFGHHMLVDPGRRAPYQREDARQGAPYHNVARPDRLFPTRPWDRDPLHPHMSDFRTTPAFDLATIRLRETEADHDAVVRRVVYAKPLQPTSECGGSRGYVIVSDKFQSQSGKGPEPSTSYWHLSATARGPAGCSDPASPHNLQPTVGKTVVARFCGEADGAAATATLHIVPLSPDHISSIELLPGAQAGIGSEGDTLIPSTRVAVRFDAAEYPVLEQVLLPLPGPAEPRVDVHRLTITGTKDDMAVAVKVVVDTGQHTDTDVCMVGVRRKEDRVVSYGDYETDGTLARVFLGATSGSVALSGGTFLRDKKQERDLLIVTPGGANVVVTTCGSTLDILRTGAPQTLRFFAPGVQSVMCNGTPALLRRDGSDCPYVHVDC